MKSLLIVLSFSVLPLTIFGQKTTQPEVIRDTAAFLEELGKRLREAAVEDYQPSKTKVIDKKAEYPVPASISETQLKAMNTAFVGSFSFRPSPFSPNELLVENDNFFYPEPRLVSVDIKWIKAIDKSGKNWLIPGEKTNEIVDFSVHYSGSQTIKLSSEVAKNIVRVEAEIKVKAPVQFEKINLTKDLLFKTQRLDTMQVRLLRIENDLAGFWVSGDYKNIESYPFNQHGMQLTTNANSSMTLGGNLKDLEGLKLPKDLGPGSFMYIKANGTVDRIEVLTVTKFMEQKIKTTLVPISPPESGKLKSDKERYQAFHPTDFGQLPKPDTLAFKGKDKFAITKDYNEWSKETKWRISYQLPSQWIQTAYALPEFKNFTVFLKNKPVKTYEREGFFDRETGTLNYVPLDDEYQPINYDEVRGEVYLKYPTTIQTLVVKKGEKKYGIEKIEGNKISLNEDGMGESKNLINESQLSILRAYGKGAWPLKKDNYSVSESIDGVQLYQYFYLGNIQSVQLDQPGDWIEMTLPFALKKGIDKTPVKKKK